MSNDEEIELHGLLMDYRGALLPEHAQAAYEAICKWLEPKWRSDGCCQHKCCDAMREEGER